MPPTRIIIHGALGRVGQVLVNALSATPEVEVVGAVDIKCSANRLVLGNGQTVPFSADLPSLLSSVRPEVMVDFSLAKAVLPAMRAAAAQGVHVVSGTTGLTKEDIAEISRLAAEKGIGVILASNFALGAVLMIHFAKVAARYLDRAEIIELHHNQKADAPSGTALTTARAMAAHRGKPFLPAADAGKDYPSRGENVDGIPIHSVRLPGLMAHQEVLLGGLGQTLTIRHDTINRECYVPGVLLAVQAVSKQKGLVQGLDSLLDLS